MFVFVPFVFALASVSVIQSSICIWHLHLTLPDCFFIRRNDHFFGGTHKVLRKRRGILREYSSSGKP